jgi:drug/metabolite transporter (DMT)-like permease
MIGIAGGIANSAFQTAMVYGDVIRVMILFYMLPVWSVIGGRIFLKEKIDNRRMIAVILCLAGAAIILDVWHTSWQGISWIDLLAICSGLGLASTNILFRFTQSVPLMSKVSVMFIGCTIIIGAFLVASTTSAELPDNQAIPLAIVYGAVWICLITVGTQWAVTRMEAGRSSIIIVMELVVAVVSAAIITHAALGINEMIGGIMVIAAALLEGMRSEEAVLPRVSDSSPV